MQLVGIQIYNLFRYCCVIDWYLHLLFIYTQRGWLILELIHSTIQVISRIQKTSQFQMTKTAREADARRNRWNSEWRRYVKETVARLPILMSLTLSMGRNVQSKSTWTEYKQFRSEKQIPRTYLDQSNYYHWTLATLRPEVYPLPEESHRGRKFTVQNCE